MPPAKKPLGPGAAVKVALTSRDPSLACQSLVTPRYVAQAYGDASGCAAALRSGGVADGVEVLSTKSEGRFTLVVARPRGGPSDGERLTLSLVRDGGLWRIESARSNAPVGP